jgi:putative NIF3 family GTP cyclohydrolase 1 type 2
VCGDLDAEVSSLLLTVDVTAAVVQEALDAGADLVVAHHPLFLRPVHGVGTDTVKGRLVHRLLGAGCGLFTAHTNADSAAPGVSDALARTVGLTGLSPLAAKPQEPLDQVVVLVPTHAADAMVDALAAAGAGRLGEYARCAWSTTGTGTFEPGPGAHPVEGRVGERAVQQETRVEMVAPRARREAVLARCAARTPTRSPPSRCSSWPRGRPRAAWAGSGRCPSR